MARNLFVRYSMNVVGACAITLGLWYVLREGIASNVARGWHAANLPVPQQNHHVHNRAGVNVTINHPPTVHNVVHPVQVAHAGYNPLHYIPTPQSGAVFYERTPAGPVVITRQRFEQLARTHGANIWQQVN